MGFLREAARIFNALVRFYWEIRLWWAVPLVIAFFVFALLMIKGANLSVSPFVYTMF